MADSLNKTTVLELAKWVIFVFQKNNMSLTNLNLQKILYYIQAWHLANFQNPLFDEEPEAWVNGPVYASVYDEYKKHGFNPITIELIEDDTIDKNTDNHLSKMNLSITQIELMEEVVRVYGKMSSFKLVDLTHTEDPWKDAREGLGEYERTNNLISHESMKIFYAKLLSRNNS